MMNTEANSDSRAGLVVWALAMAAGLYFGQMAVAQAQMFESPWGFRAQNRASIAAMIDQVENRDKLLRRSQAGSAGQSITTLVCGSDGTSSAKGNASCIILNNSAGGINLGQDTQGNQTADNNQQQAVSTVNEESSGSVSDVLETLNGMN